MTATDIDALIEMIDLYDLADRRVLSDAMLEAGREDEMRLLRESGDVVALDGRIVRVLSKAWVEQALAEYADHHGVDVGDVLIDTMTTEDAEGAVVIVGVRLSLAADGKSRGDDERIGEWR